MPANLGKTAPQRRFMPKLPIRHPQAAGRMQVSFEPVDLAIFTAELASNFHSAGAGFGKLLTFE